MKNIKNRLRRVLALGLAVLCLLAVPLASFAAEETPAQKLERLQNEKKEIASQIETSKKSAEKAAYLKELYIRQQETLRAEITTLQQTIADTQAQLAALQTQLANTLAKKEGTQLLFEQRLDAMYRTTADNEMETLLGARTFAELLRTANDLQQIALADTKML